MTRILLVDDDEQFASATAEILEMLGHTVDCADTVKSASRLLATRPYNRVLLDLMLPDGSGLHVLEHLPAAGSTRITIITGHPSVKNHVQSLYGINVNYLIKPISVEQLQQLLEETPEPDRSQNPSASRKSGKRHFGELIGESDVMQALYTLIERVARSEANVMLMGESGVGKEMVARAIHNASGCEGPLIASNCGAMTAELIGSELFGHEKGAFTGAINRKIGVFEQAGNGTLFLDEITEMPLDMQTNLLRVLETQTVTRLGGTESIAVDCRVVSATNRTEQELVEQGTLREDIYYRLAVFPLHIPPLRERKEDIPLLAQAFLGEFNAAQNSSLVLDNADIDRLRDYEWPGNVRELRHVVHRAFIMSDPGGQQLSLPKSFSSPFSRKAAASTSFVGSTIEDVERQLIMETLAKVDGNKTRAAEMLGVSVKTLYNRLNSYEEADSSTS